MKHTQSFNEFLNESSIGDIHIMAQEADSFTAFRKEFMDEYGKPKSVKELKSLEAWLQTIWNENQTNEALSMDAVYIHQITGSGQDAAQNFIDDNNIDSAKLVAFLKQHKDSKEKYDVRDMINGTNKNKRFMKQFLKESVNEEYGGPGNYSVPEDHLAGLRVPKGGSCCANCEYWIAKEEICTNTHYQEWAGTNKIPYPADEYCTDWYEPAPKYNLEE